MYKNKISYDNGLLKIISEDLHYGLETVHPLMTLVEQFKYDLSENLEEYRGIELGIVTPYHTNLGAFPKVRVPLNHGTNKVLNLIRTFPSAPGIRNNIEELLENIPKNGFPQRFIPEPNLYIKNTNEHYVESGTGNMIKLLEISYVSENKIKGAKLEDFNEFINKNKDADIIFAYAKDEPRLNSVFRHAGMKYARGNVGRDSKDRLFVWYMNP